MGRPCLRIHKVKESSDVWKEFDSALNLENEDYLFDYTRLCRHGEGELFWNRYKAIGKTITQNKDNKLEFVRKTKIQVVANVLYLKLVFHADFNEDEWNMLKEQIQTQDFQLFITIVLNKFGRFDSKIPFEETIEPWTITKIMFLPTGMEKIGIRC